MYMNKTSWFLMGNIPKMAKQNSHLEALWGYLSPQIPRALWMLLRATNPSSEGLGSYCLGDMVSALIQPSICASGNMKCCKLLMCYFARYFY